MISVRTFAATAALAFSLLLVGCAPSTKNEQQYWDNNNKAAAEYSAKWPAFKTLIAAHQTKAKPMWDEASKVADEKQKAEKMKAANEALNDGLLSKLGEIKYKSQDLEKTVAQLNSLKLTKDKDATRDAAVASGQRALSAVETALSTAKPASDDEAVKLLSDQISKLISSNGDADRSLKALKGKKLPAGACRGGPVRPHAPRFRGETRQSAGESDHSSRKRRPHT
jgi:hypothetical protein